MLLFQKMYQYVCTYAYSRKETTVCVVIVHLQVIEHFVIESDWRLIDYL